MSIEFSSTATRKERERYEKNLQWRIQIRVSQNIGDSDNDQLKNVKDWHSNGNVGDGTIGRNLLLTLQPGGRHKNRVEE